MANRILTQEEMYQAISRGQFTGEELASCNCGVCSRRLAFAQDDKTTKLIIEEVTKSLSELQHGCDGYYYTISKSEFEALINRLK